MDCKTCKRERTRGEREKYIDHEVDMARLDLANRRMFVIIIVLLVLLAGTNAAWIIYESQYESQYAEVEVDTGEGDAYVSGIGDVTYGESENQSEN